MKDLKKIFLLFTVFLALNSYCQNNTIVKKDSVHIATLIVDYSTYNFEGGNISYYTCPTCFVDSIPFTIDYTPPGDFGNITFSLSPTEDTVFHATTTWMGTGEILYPNKFDMEESFRDTNTATTIPNDLRYISRDGTTITDTSILHKADSAWNVVNSLKITNLCNKNGFKSAIYYYTPTDGVLDLNNAKWIIFLYHHKQSITTQSNELHTNHIQIFPNPANKADYIYIHTTNSNTHKYRIFNSYGQLIQDGNLTKHTMHEIDIKALHKGTYILHINDNNYNTIATKKIIIE
ncbi:MAG: T9SS type A sorting domain-containing protein [Bacteroidales bacterium]